MSTVFDPLRLSAVSLDVMAANHDSARGLARRRQARLAQLLDAALNGSRLYRELLAGATARTPLEDLPVVTRSQLMERFDDWVTDPCLTLDGLRAFTADPSRIAEPWQGRYMVWESSGTSGQPGIFVQDAQAMAVYDALEALRRCAPRPLQRWLDPLCLAERIAFVGATSGHFASYISVQRMRTLNPLAGGQHAQFFHPDAHTGIGGRPQRLCAHGACHLPHRCLAAGQRGGPWRLAHSAARGVDWW